MTANTIEIISIADIMGLNIVLNAIRKPPKTNEYPRILENFLYVLHSLVLDALWLLKK